MKKDPNTLKLLIPFLLGVLILAVLSISYKVFIQIKDSQFIYSTTNFLIVDRDAYLFHIDENDDRLVRVKVSNGGEEFSDISKFSASILLGIPVEAMLISKDQLEFNTGSIRFSTVLGTIFSKKSYMLDGLNEFDVFKAHAAISSNDNDEIVTIDVDMPKKQDSTINQIVIDDYEYFRDSKIFNERVAVEIVNASEINGFAAITSDMLERAGYNVISTETGEETESGIYIRDTDTENTETLKRLKRIFEIKDVKLDDDLISDISIVVGPDLVEELVESSIIK